MARARKRRDGFYKRSFTYEGKRYYIYAKTYDELDERVLEKKAELKKGFEKRNNPTLAEYFDTWEESRRGCVSENTLRWQRTAFSMMGSVYIPDADRTLAEIKLKSISKDDLVTLQKELRKTRSTQTTNDYLAILNHVLSDAMKERLIDYNPFVNIKKLKRTETKVEKTIHRALTPAEQKTFFENERCKNSFYYNVYRIAILTGMRFGEIGALRYSDVRNGFIHIERSITRTELGNYVIGDVPKTSAGERKIPINDAIKTVLADQKELNDVLDGNVHAFDDLLFKAPERGLLKNAPADRELKRICQDAGIPYFTMHAFRSTFATRCCEEGMNLKTLQKLMGHEKFETTMDIYAKAIEETQVKELNNIKIVI